MLASARLGDKHVCPKTGHGTTPIASASADVNISFAGAARVGDTCGCGAVITTGFPSILVNNRPLAHLGSPTSHGGTIITGSSDTFGGFVMGGAPDAAIVNFAALGVFRPDGSIDDEKMATLLADPRLIEKATAAKAVVNSDEGVTELEKGPASEAEPAVCTHPDMMEVLAGYIADEMNRNIRHPSVLKMKELLSYDVVEETRKKMALPWYYQIGTTNPQAIGASNTVAAMALWTERVGQNRPWDHKPKIHTKFGGYRHKQGKYDYFYDIWSNIHYGYVGMAGGLTEGLLLDGAGLEQIVSDKLRQWEEMLFVPKDQRKLRGPHATEGVEGLRAWDDAPDRISVSIGIQLYSENPNGSITAKMIMEKVLAITPTEWGDGIRVHECEKH
ncbi:PAAR domain-containing protein [Pseudomonas cichorii]|uniref:polymorphic toxin type 44 domain-containing protein n=1 Tax=Pseudomonas cichorii TaxID=36746 RepID=UPI001C887A92|nr:polymorphic toxin type 44 domain-containing protein [Pseudomonas cichorii]MBX8516120.1 PAAR domain-containing protein [Pseudomonas cichorii]MBX8541711.1 PAAR domain-containing protein [Pseudomonas cichorii]MBX8561401.1 PAAR domain-containing protein [Pseudomonas cichorii]MBX8567390.1 PAAR domain-containing protein [Pseudomonas cichorii]MBX8581400.1 PAAR domain-containing protein [Pseudomonas cichorii]